MVETKTCPIDGGAMKPVFSATVLGKYDVHYFVCQDCSFLQTEDPHWLEEAYRDAIAACDTGIMERNLHNALRIAAVLRVLGFGRSRIIDIAGGYGILTRLLRDIGFDCLWSDKYSDNLLAKGFEAPEGLPASALCALEVLEHVHDPVAFLRGAIEAHGASAVVFSTEAFERLPDRNWWYFSRESGQHISFYSIRSLEKLAGRLGWSYARLPRNLHLFTAAPLSGWKALLLGSYMIYPCALWSVARMRNRSRTRADQEHAMVRGA